MQKKQFLGLVIKAHVWDLLRALGEREREKGDLTYFVILSIEKKYIYYLSLKGKGRGRLRREGRKKKD